MGAPICLYGFAEKDNALDVVAIQRFDGKNIFHDGFSSRAKFRQRARSPVAQAQNPWTSTEDQPPPGLGGESLEIADGVTCHVLLLASDDLSLAQRTPDDF
jgi:hypothetical protein